MKNILSHLVKFLLLIFITGVVLVMIYILPLAAKQTATMFIEIAYAKNHVLIICEILCALLIAGIFTILYLLFMFDKGKAFTIKFVRALDFIIALSVIVTFFVAGLFTYLTVLGGTGALLGIALVGGYLSIIILIFIEIVIRKIILEAITFKQENDLTV